MILCRYFKKIMKYIHPYLLLPKLYLQIKILPDSTPLLIIRHNNISCSRNPSPSTKHCHLAYTSSIFIFSNFHILYPIFYYWPYKRKIPLLYSGCHRFPGPGGFPGADFLQFPPVPAGLPSGCRSPGFSSLSIRFLCSCLACCSCSCCKNGLGAAKTGHAVPHSTPTAPIIPVHCLPMIHNPRRLLILSGFSIP